jgi:hypothetical protein
MSWKIITRLINPKAFETIPAAGEKLTRGMKEQGFPEPAGPGQKVV